MGKSFKFWYILNEKRMDWLNELINYYLDDISTKNESHFEWEVSKVLVHI